MEIKEGTILVQKTSDEILLDLDGRTQAINEHEEHWLVEETTKDKVKLYNLDSGSTWKLEKAVLIGMIKGSKRFNLKPMFRISEEVA